MRVASLQPRPVCGLQPQSWARIAGRHPCVRSQSPVYPPVDAARQRVRATRTATPSSTSHVGAKLHGHEPCSHRGPCPRYAPPRRPTSAASPSTPCSTEPSRPTLRPSWPTRPGTPRPPGCPPSSSVSSRGIFGVESWPTASRGFGARTVRASTCSRSVASAGDMRSGGICGVEGLPEERSHGWRSLEAVRRRDHSAYSGRPDLAGRFAEVALIVPMRGGTDPLVVVVHRPA